ncbi:hypothetical protein ABBQ32_002752 [Trebouxia sp. C0010 RCD-2024]
MTDSAAAGKSDPQGAACTVDYSRHFGHEGQARQLASLRVLLSAFTGVPGIIGLHGGLPPADAFPFTEMSFTLRDGTKMEIKDPAQVAAAQQYSVTLRGYPALHDWVKKHTWALHSPPGDHDVLVTGGSNATIEMLMSLLMNPGDTIMCEEFTYPHMIESFVIPKGFKVLGITTDDQGIVPEALSKALEGRTAQGSKAPRLLYTVPVGQNPTGVVTPLDRRRQIYSICRKHDIIILEDDPYFYLQFSVGNVAPRGLQDLGSSYLSLDIDGRVIRLDSFSKVLSPGLRLGWATAAPALLEKLIFHLHGSTLGPCALSQVVVASLLHHWGPQGFEQHVKDMQQGYARRAHILHAAAERHLQGLAEWQEPRAGMFAWLRLFGGIQDADQILDKLKEEKVVVVPGRIAHCEGPRPTSACPYIRVSFASAADADLEEGIKRLATVIKSFQQETAAKAKTNGNAVGGSGPAAFHGGYGNGNTENGSHVQQQSTEGSVQQILHDNEKMGLAAAIRTAANSQPEGC